MNKQEKYFLVLLIGIILLMRLYHVDVAPVEIEESWRQADTESIARNYVGYDFNPFHPNFNYDGPLPNIPALEIQVTTYLIAILYKVFGYHYFLARMVPIAFFMISAIYLFGYVRKHLGYREAVFSLLVYGILPINLFYSRAIMPESAALMFWIGSFYYFHGWAEERKISRLIISCIFLSLAIMTKPPVIIIGIPMLFICYKYFGWRWLKFAELWIYALLIITLPFLYYYYSGSIAEYKFAIGITNNIILKEAFSAFYSPEAYLFYTNSIPKMLSMSGTILIIAGIWAIVRKNKVILIWFMAMVLEVFLIVSAIRAPYYLIFFAVPCSILIGNLLANFFSNPQGKVISVVLLLVISLESFYLVKPMYTRNTTLENQVAIVQQVTKKDDLLVVGSLDPCLLSLSDRRGWRFNIGIYSHIPQDPFEELDFYIEKGAKYFVPIQGKVYGDEDGLFLRYLESEYEKIEPIQDFPIYVLE